jgi:4-diphosphocytidyl-2-C-methyl-D-erythritol kinase
MVTFPGCKINLGLHVLSRRPDGYHAIHTCFYPVPWTDVLEAIPAEKFSFTCTGLPIPGPSENNLCVKAYGLLKNDFDLPPIQAHLHKLVPMGAGLGGGSADAAQFLRIVNELFSLKLTREQLSGYASRLGSDCSFFLDPAPALGSGRGEILEPVAVSLKGLYLVIVSPVVHVSTADAYAGVTPGPPREDLRKTLARPVGEWKDNLVNDFEKSIFKRFPELAGIKERLYDAGALYASMSGSGSSVFGLFDKHVDREDLFPGSRGWSGRL